VSCREKIWGAEGAGEGKDWKRGEKKRGVFFQLGKAPPLSYPGFISIRLRSAVFSWTNSARSAQIVINTGVIEVKGMARVSSGSEHPFLPGG